MNLLLVLGNQLFDPALWPKELRNSKPTVFMREDTELCTYYQFHKHKILFFLLAMRNYCEEIKELGLETQYQKLSEQSQKTKYEKALKDFVTKNKIKTLWFFEIEDKFFESRILKLAKDLDLETRVLKSPMFLTDREEFKQYLLSVKKPFMKTFYERQRKTNRILVDKNNKPKGGQWSFDAENRKALPENIQPPLLHFSSYSSENFKEIAKICNSLFKSHPGETDNFWIPTTRKEAAKWLKDFLENKLAEFGPFEDALPKHSDFVFHSVLTPFLNCGLLTPKQVIDSAIKHSEKSSLPIESLEGFVRQILGWREFIRGIYQNFSEQQETTNFWKHNRKLSSVWYKGNCSVPIVERTLQKVFRYGYCHHIERLMVLGNLMLLLEIDPKESHKWFMEMFVDSSDWVMGPNVYGMALFSDGGIFSTKPYICGSNYWRKMSKEPEGDWCDGIDGLYWGFIAKHKSFFSKNPRLSMMVRSLEKIPKDRLNRIYSAADKLRQELSRT